MDNAVEPLTINVTPAVEIYGKEKDSPDLYKNCSWPRGMVFMANYRDFDNKPSKCRTGSEIDVKNLTSLFEQMGYKVPEPHINMTYNDTKEAINEFIKKPELHNVDSCIIAIMSHGRDGKFYTTDNLSLQINDDILEKFSSSQCPALSGKPKIFILQCCRSRHQGKGVANDVVEVSNRSQQDSMHTEEEDDANNFLAGVRVANIADMYIIYSTVEGYVSFRNQDRGSRLIYGICDIFMNNAFYLDLEALMKKVSVMVRQLCGDKKKMQVCEIVMRGFDRQFYFNPQPLGDIKGSAVCIYRNQNAYPHILRTLLDRPEIRDLPLFILAVAGEYRTGKSFLLSYFLRYLKKQVFNWLGDENEPLVGFDHKYDDQSVTQGINIWDQPLIVNVQKEDGSVQRILVLLMDSQGIFSSNDEEEATCTFALTTMISSVLIFNLTHQLNESILNHLQLFTAYAREATFEDTDKKPFQKLMLLIRDWEKKSIKPFGSQGGNEYFHAYFKDKRHYLHDAFRDIACYLMPRPGDCVEEDDYNGCHKQLRRDFKDHLKVLTEHLFEPGHLVQNQKEITGEIITAGDFCNYFENCIQLLTLVDWKQPHNMLKIHKKFNCDLAKKEGLKVYKTDMDKNFQARQLLMTEEEIHSIDQDARVKATNIYDAKCSFTHKNDPELCNEEKQRLIEDLTEEFANYKQGWEVERQKKREQELKSQVCAIREAKKVYKAYIEKSIQEKESLIDVQLQRIDENAKAEAMKKYEDMCSINAIIFHALYSENEQKLIEDLSEEFSNYKRQQDQLRRELDEIQERERQQQQEHIEKLEQDHQRELEHQRELVQLQQQRQQEQQQKQQLEQQRQDHQRELEHQRELAQLQEQRQQEQQQWQQLEQQIQRQQEQYDRQQLEQQRQIQERERQQQQDHIEKLEQDHQRELEHQRELAQLQEQRKQEQKQKQKLERQIQRQKEKQEKQQSQIDKLQKPDNCPIS